MLTRYRVLQVTPLIPSRSFLLSLLAYLQDPNPPVLFKMVEPLTALQEKVRTFLDEWPDHPGLLKILEIIASLLAMPLSAPLSKRSYLDCNFWLGKLKHCRKMTPSSFLKIIFHQYSCFYLHGKGLS
uniref:Uncharacterized protein n=1 Tax=Aegilops tauschii subsp. strangulata TaxID=200361 RepID=A0A452YBW8_AEGTS